MRPGEQQPGGEPSSQWSNPYQQPGYQQSNPYQDQQAGGQWQQPTGQPPVGRPPAGPQYPGQQATGQWQQPGPIAPSATDGGGTRLTPDGGGGGRRGRTAIAVAVATAVVAAAVVTGVVVLGGEDDKEANAGGDGGASPSAEETGESGETEEPEQDRPDPDDPRQGVLQVPDPVVAPDWQVQTIENRHNAFDVPPDDWTVGAESLMVGYEDTTNDDEEAEDELSFGDPVISMSAPSTYLEDWCAESETGVSWRAVAGTKGGQGATGTEEAVRNEAGSWALAAYDQERQGNLQVTDAEPFESEHGIVGHTATATITDVPEDPENECGTWDGKVVAVSYLDLNNDLATWVLVMDTGYPEELDDETVEQIMNSLRPYPEEGSNA
ncbi:hypothetical protein [Streptomyces sp. MP131-18]|uniref:hypothetical protein n=1 Tax=Streptomyces sp. MP131-18 TaxID=1857892 RepID=UPI00097CA6E4|nr:hypothetical protein [Streptomyces sp. MP131-18]ONK15922.1 hypothetical protein STBA_67650 [Streptomyces sp. MP131-18]